MTNINTNTAPIAAAIAHIEGVTVSTGSLGDDDAMGVEINIEELGGDPEDALEAAYAAINFALAPLDLALGEGVIVDGIEFVVIGPCPNAVRRERLSDVPGYASQVYTGWVWMIGSTEYGWSKSPTREGCEKAVEQAIALHGVAGAFDLEEDE